MLKVILENVRTNMLNCAEIYGRSAPITVETSQQLDYLLNLYHEKFCHPNPLKLKQRENLHVKGGIISNIIQASAIYDSKLFTELKDFHLISRDVHDWYPLQEFEAIFSHLQKYHYGDTVLSLIGQYVPINCTFPKNLTSFHHCLRNLNKAFHLNHSNRSAGYYEVLFMSDEEILVICNTPGYPHSFNRGVLEGIAAHYNLKVAIDTLDTVQGGEFKIEL
jgi:hypothetical protein